MDQKERDNKLKSAPGITKKTLCIDLAGYRLNGDLIMGRVFESFGIGLVP